MSNLFAERILESRKLCTLEAPAQSRSWEAAEGGCGVLGFAANLPVAGRHVMAASAQMHNRGNGKGGGIAMAGLSASQCRVDAQTLRSHYLLQIAYLDPQSRREVEGSHILPCFEVAVKYEIDRLEDYRAIEGLDMRPPDVWRYFVRVKPDILARFAVDNGLEEMNPRAVENEFVYQNTYRLNTQYYASLGEKRAFVLSHGRDLSVLKIVGYAEQVVEYYQLSEQTAHVWIAHQRYPTKGRVWHPGGAHPFIGLNEALVHNGDFANYHAVSEYLRQRNIGQLFLTDTEVSVQLFDLWDRVYGYPLEITLEAMATTTEHDFQMLSEDKKKLYQAVQRTHIHGSPDGPWFFIVASTKIDDREPANDRYELLGITDTSMLRPQVFALYENSLNSNGSGVTEASPDTVQIGLIASERQAINACLRSLAAEDERFQPLADRYWVARGGSYTDGGAFRFAFNPAKGGPRDGGRLECVNKFGLPVQIAAGRRHAVRSMIDPQRAASAIRLPFESRALVAFDDGGAGTLFDWLEPHLKLATWDDLAWVLGWLQTFGRNGPDEWEFAWQTLTLLRDRHYDSGDKKRASVTALVDEGLRIIFERIPGGQRLDWATRGRLQEPAWEQAVLAIDTLGFPAEGDESAARWLARAVELGWRSLVTYNWRGGRFAACGLGPESQGVRLDLYGDVGDYVGSGLDGCEVHLHGDGQDQVGQILKRGKLVIYGDVGQTFLYGAKGGEVYVLGSAAGRPLINAAGKPRAVINGTCLDYLAESFMAGDPHKGGGFVILNGMAYDEAGELHELESPYPGGNLFSLASGGAIFIRDPHHKVEDEQLNGGAFADLSAADWSLIEPYLKENERLFGIRVEDLLTVMGERRSPETVYRKVEVGESGVLQAG